MTWLTPRPALLLGAALALTGMATVAAPTAAAQSAAAPSAAVSAAPSSPTTGRADATETAAPRRRPTRRSAARAARPDSTFRTVSSLTSARRTDASASAAEAASAAARSAMLAVALRVEGREWVGIPYRWGGTSRRGIDCSAFVQQFVRETMGVELPRATAGQQYEGVGVAKSDLIPGDLVFFRRGGTRHVGVYLGENEFIHASTSRGVTVSDLSEGYYERHYWMARRVLDAPSGRRPTPRSFSRTDSSGVRG